MSITKPDINTDIITPIINNLKFILYEKSYLRSNHMPAINPIKASNGIHQEKVESN
jgi:hypothetical protein